MHTPCIADRPGRRAAARGQLGSDDRDTLRIDSHHPPLHSTPSFPASPTHPERTNPPSPPQPPSRPNFTHPSHSPKTTPSRRTKTPRKPRSPETGRTDSAPNTSVERFRGAYNIACKQAMSHESARTRPLLPPRLRKPLERPNHQPISSHQVCLARVACNPCSHRAISPTRIRGPGGTGVSPVNHQFSDCPQSAAQAPHSGDSASPSAPPRPSPRHARPSSRSP